MDGHGFFGNDHGGGWGIVSFALQQQHRAARVHRRTHVNNRRSSPHQGGGGQKDAQ